MTNDEILKLLRSAHEYALPNDTEARALIQMDVGFAELGVSSISAMEIGGFVEDELGVNLPDDELANIGTVSDFVSMIQRCVSKRKS